MSSDVKDNSGSAIVDSDAKQPAMVVFKKCGCCVAVDLDVGFSAVVAYQKKGYRCVVMQKYEAISILNSSFCLHRNSEYQQQLELTAEDQSLFKREHLGTFQTPPLLKFVEEYEARCEAYDQTVCTGRRDCEAVAMTGREAAISSRNATIVLKEIAERENISWVELFDAIRKYRKKNR